ncbi:MAG: CHC2 zinc finger domain-containing protein, partial [Gammaproteobacteria bacterium]
MARIPEVEIERLKSEVSVERLVEASGVALKRTGKDLFGCCPIHEDAEASLSVTPSKNLWHCFGCGAGGGPIDWVMRRNGVSFRHAVELLREGVPSLAAAPVKRSSVRALPAPVALEADDQALLAQAIGYYHETLKASPEALGYLERRGIAHPEAIERFRLGFANSTLGYRLPGKHTNDGEQLRARLQRIGILRESGHEHFNGSLVIPVMDEAGRITELYGRKITEALRAGTARHLYLPAECRGSTRGVWNVEALAASKEVILCEALIDALTFWCAGYRNVTAAYGTEGFTEEHLAAFKRHKTERVLIAYDRDEPGERAAEKLAPVLIAQGIECWRIQFPKGMDANEYALKVQPAARSLAVVIRKALWLGKGKEPERAEASPVAMPSASLSPEASAFAQARAGAISSLAANLAAKEKSSPTDAPAASPVPQAALAPSAPELREHELELRFGDRRYRVRGLAKNTSYEILKVNVLAARGDRFHVDTVDLRNSKQKHSYISQGALELELREDIVKDDLGKLFHKLEALRDA